MTPERYAEIRKIAGRDGQTWRSSAVSLVALNEVLDELDRLRSIVVEYDRAQLRCFMSNISEDYWCAGWISSLEVMLWRAVTGDEVTVGAFGAKLAEWEVAELKRLSESAGGWFAWGKDEDGDAGAQFVPMAEWIERYAQVKE